MKLIDDWRWVVKKAWSIRLTILGAIFGAAEMTLPIFSDAIPRGTFLALSLVATIGGAVARLVAQPKMHDGE